MVWDIFQWRLSGLSYQNIARKLNERGIPSPARYHYLKGDAKSEKYANTVWSVTAVKKICTDPVYLGHMVTNTISRWWMKKPSARFRGWR